MRRARSISSTFAACWTNPHRTPIPPARTTPSKRAPRKFTGENGWADVWRRGRFAWEYKKQRGDLDAAYRQLLLYAGPLGNPPLLVVSDIARIVVRTNFTNTVTERHEIPLAELADPRRLRLLKWVFSDPEQLRPARTRQALTEEAAAEFAELARRLRVREHDAQVVAHFVNRLVFCMFADKMGLLPAGLFEQMLALAKRRPARSAGYASKLFAAMANSGGEVGFVDVPWFDGGLFDDATALPLERDDIDLLIRVAKLDWAEIDPSILGTLFERGLDPDKRSQLGAHYTNREKIELLIDPVIRRPLQAEWTAVRAKIEAALAQPAARGRRAGNGHAAAQALYHAFLAAAAAVPRARPGLRFRQFPVSQFAGAEGPGASGERRSRGAGAATRIPAGGAGDDARHRDQPVCRRTRAGVGVDRAHSMDAPARLCGAVGPRATAAGHDRVPGCDPDAGWGETELAAGKRDCW